ncbi:hypothetical protein [Actinomycetospora sp. CA-053990]|uniref:hypothetical protein n=1 Tax=Actinomycetospora sp. CA-053990 TaxID=3239891 RepID=UPI003D8B6D2D
MYAAEAAQGQPPVQPWSPWQPPATSPVDAVSAPPPIPALPDSAPYAGPPATPQAAPERVAPTAPAPADRPEPDLSNAPGLWPLSKLPFKKRADFMRQFDKIMPLADAMKDRKEGDEVGAELAADLYDMLDIVDQALGQVAANSEQYQAWDGRFDEDKLMALFQKYMDGFQPGNSGRSTS